MAIGRLKRGFACLVAAMGRAPPRATWVDSTGRVSLSSTSQGWPQTARYLSTYWSRSTGAPPSSGQKPLVLKPPEAPRNTYVPPALVPCTALTTWPALASFTAVHSPSGSEVDFYFTTSQS